MTAAEHEPSKPKNPPKPKKYQDGTVYYGTPVRPHIVETKVKTSPGDYGKYCCGGTKTHESTYGLWHVYGKKQPVLLCNGCKRLLVPPTAEQFFVAEGLSWQEIESLKQEMDAYGFDWKSSRAA